MKKTNIQYLDYTWNPVSMRCDRVSPGCDNCWHLRMANRLAANPMMGLEKRPAYAGGNPVMDGAELDAPLKLKKPSRIGVQFMGDLFHEKIQSAWLSGIFNVMKNCPQHTFFILTKRPKHLLNFVAGLGELDNIWFGVSVENQETADRRIPILLQCPVKHRWISAEPLLGKINIIKYLGGCNETEEHGRTSLQGCGNGRIGNRHRGESLEGSLSQGGSLELRDKGDSLSTATCRKKGEKVFSSSSYDWDAQGKCTCASSGMETFPRVNSSGNDYKSQERDRDGQPIRKYGTGDILRTNQTCNIYPGFSQKAEYSGAICWLVCGAETGPKKRPMEWEWAINLADQCAGVPFYFKEPWEDAPDEVNRRELPK